MAEPIPTPPAVSPVINLDSPGRSPPASAGLLKDLLIPCCLAGSFLCALCETGEASLLCSAQTAFTHLTKTHKDNAATKEITQKLCVDLYGWLRAVLPAGVWLDYLALDPPAGQDPPPLPTVLSPRKYPPPLPGRSTKPGLVCSKCSSCFSKQKSASRHTINSCSGGSFSKCTMMELHKGRSVAVSTSEAVPIRDQALMSACDQAVLLALEVAHRATLPPPAFGFVASAAGPPLLPRHVIHGASQVTESGTASRPRYLEILNWHADLNEPDAGRVQVLTEPVRIGDGSDDTILYEEFHELFMTTVAGGVSIAGPTTRESVHHRLYQDGSMGRYKSFSPVTVETQRTYAGRTCQLIVVCYRIYKLDGCKELHSYSEISVPGILNLFEEVIKARREASASDARDLQTTMRLARIFLSLLSECARPKRNDAYPADSTTLPAVVLGLSAGSPALIAALCISLVQREQAGYRFASAEHCRHLAVALLYDIKSFVVWAIETWSGQHLFPRPVPQSVAGAGVPLALLHVGTMLGDEDGTRLLQLVSANNTVFQAAVSVTCTARREVEHPSLLTSTFSPLHLYHANEYQGKAVCEEALPCARLVAQYLLIDMMKKVLEGCGSQKIIPLYDFIDSGKMNQIIIFGATIEEMNRRAELLPNREKVCRTPGIIDMLRELPRLLALAIYFDVLGLGPRASEYANLLALPTSGIERAVKLDATGSVMLLVGSEKNGKSTVLHLSPELNHVFIAYLAYIRPYLCHLLYPDKKEMACWLFPGLTPDSLRDGITKTFSSVNQSLMKLRTDKGLQPLQPDSITNIGAQVIRQEAHRALYQLCLPDFLTEVDKFSSMMKECRPNLMELAMQSPGLKNFVHNIAIPKMASMNTLHSPETAYENYGRTGEPVAKPIMLASSVWLGMFRSCLMNVLTEAQKRFPGTFNIASPQQVGAAADSHRGSSKKRAAPADLGQSGHSDLPSPPGPKESRLVSQQVQHQQRDDDERALYLCEQVDNNVRNRFGYKPLYISDNQRLAVHTAAKGDSAIVLLPTGSGKAWVWICYALAFPTRLVIVVLPLASLEQNMFDRVLQAFHGDEQYVFWLNSAPIENLQSPRLSKVRIIITSPERLGDQLTSFLAGRRPDLVCVDEVHEFGLAASYRPCFLDVPVKIRQLGAPIVCATATACKRMQDFILKAFYSGPQTTPKIISESCSRKNICYQVLRYDGNRRPVIPPMDAFATKMEALLTDQGSPWCLGAMMIFTHEKLDCNKLCEVLRARLPDIVFDVFHGDMLPVERKDTLDKFTSGKIKVLICTQAIGCGFDYNGVSCVVHYGMAATSVQAYLQQSGRAARPKSVHKYGLALVFFVPELHERFVDLLEKKDSQSGETILAKQYNLPLPNEAANQTATYCNLTPPNCRQRWLAREQGEENALTCLELAHQVSPMVDLARCDLCAPNPRSYASSQEVGLRASEIFVQQLAWPDALKQLKERIRPHLYGGQTQVSQFCLHCSLQKGESQICQKGRPPFKGHQGQFLFGRCYNCASSLHVAKECNELKELQPHKPGAVNRCYWCLAYMLGAKHDVSQCKTSFCVLAVAAYALELTPRHVLSELLPEELKAALIAGWEMQHGLRRKVNEVLLRGADMGEPGKCWAHKILEFLDSHFGLDQNQK